MLVPVERGARVAADLEVAHGGPVEDAALLVGDAQLVARHGLTGGAALDGTRRLEQKMCSISVEPMPSTISRPKRSCHIHPATDC